MSVFTLPRLAAAAVLGLMLIGAATPTVMAQAQSVDPETAKVEKIVRDYLIRNPEVLLEAMQALKEKQQVEQDRVAQAGIRANRDALFKDPNSFVAGNPNGNFTVVEFFDYRCGYCKQARPAVAEMLKRDPNLRLVLKEFPILGPDSLTASRAAVAAMVGQNDKYYAFHQALYDYKAALNDDAVLSIARSTGLDIDKLKQDMKDPKVDQILAENRALGDKLSINGTPAFIIGNTLMPGAAPVESLMAAVAQARQSCDFC
jgi:protein-disulfide isomerase